MGAFELILILAVVMIVFGAGKLPSVMKDLGKGVKAFRDGMSDEHKSAVPPANAAAPGAAPQSPVSPPLPPTE
jgi:sec-independent protein translocase protein TatA